MNRDPRRWVVVGGGSAGSVVAARLSETAANEVTLIESGPDHGSGRTSGDNGPVLDDENRLWSGSMAERVTGRNADPYPQGCGLGGSSLISGTIAVRYSPHLQGDHLIPLESPASLGGVGGALLAASPESRELLLTRRDGRRVTAADAYLRPAMARPNLAVVTESTVDRLLIDGRQVVGVRTRSGDEFVADRVVLCAGAIRTPALMLASGIDTPGVGEGLQDHPAVAISLVLEPGSVDPDAPMITVSLERPGRHILAMNSLPDRPDLGALVTALTTVVSRGRVTLNDPDGDPAVDLAHLSAGDDASRLGAAVLECVELLEQPALRRIVRSAYIDGDGTEIAALPRDDPSLIAWLFENVSGHFHASSTCAMGLVTDEQGSVMGYDGLSIGDASLFRQVPPVNTYLAVIMQAERLSSAWNTPNPNQRER